MTVAPTLLPFLLIYRFGVNAVRFDEFFYVEFVQAIRAGANWLPWLWFQHNEHRVIPSKLVMIPNALYLHWNRVAEMYLSAALCVLIVLGLWCLERRSGRHDLLLFAPVAWLACGLAQYEVFLYGLLHCHLFTVLGVVWAFVFLDRPGLARFTTATGFGLVASFSILNGFAVWPAGAFLLLARGRRRGAAAAWLASGTVSLAIYLIGFQFEVPRRPPLDFAPSGLARSAVYAVTLLGAPVAAGRLAWGLAAGCLLVVGVAAAAMAWRRSGWQRMREDALPAALVLFGVLSSAVVSIGRISMISPLQSRYVPYSAVAMAGAYLLARAAHGRGAPALFAGVLALLSCGLLVADVHGLDQAREWRKGRLRDKFLLQTFEQQRDQDLAGHFLDVAEVRRLAPRLRAERLGSFADPQEVLLLVRWQEGVPMTEILPGQPVEQTLVCPVEELRDVEIVFATYARSNSSGLRLTIESEGRRRGERIVVSAALHDNGWVDVPLDEPLTDCQGKEVKIRIESPDARPGDAVTVWTYPSYYHGVLAQGTRRIPDRSLGVTLNGIYSGALM